MIAPTREYTVEEFDEYVLRPENIDREFEFIGGRIVEVVSNPVSSKIGALFVTHLGMYVLQNDIGHVTGADGGYRVAGERYIPDAAFISYARQPELSYEDGYVPVAPDLAVEVMSPGNKDEDMTIKVANYISVGTVVWLVLPVEQQAIVFEPTKPARRLGVDGALEGGSILPGFQLPIKNIFPAAKK